MVPPAFCVVLKTELEPIGLTYNYVASWELMFVNVLLSRIDVNSYSFILFQWSHCWLSMASAYVTRSLWIDV
jgi:hypothetical protein